MFLLHPQQWHTPMGFPSQWWSTLWCVWILWMCRRNTYTRLVLLRQLGTWCPDRSLKTNLLRNLKGLRGGLSRRLSRRKLSSDHRKWRGQGQVTRTSPIGVYPPTYVRPLQRRTWHTAWKVCPLLSFLCGLEFPGEHWRCPPVHFAQIRYYSLTQYLVLPKYFKTTSLLITAVTLWDARPHPVQSLHITASPMPPPGQHFPLNSSPTQHS